jgi:predicted nucleotidyltransferase component of viral defense system
MRSRFVVAQLFTSCTLNRPPGILKISIWFRLKVEINTREHFSVHGHTASTFAVSSRWFEGTCKIKSYQLNELLATKLRALYQRKKGRDLFDLAVALDHPDCDAATIIETFDVYMNHEDHKVSRSRFQENVAAKLADRNFVSDVGPLLASGYEWNPGLMGDAVMSQLIDQLPE